MLSSMTGFASKIIALTLDDGSKASMTISIKSLNSRFFEATCKLPPQCAQLEAESIKLLKHALHRGHIYFSLYVSNNNLFKGTIEPSFSLIGSYTAAIKKVQEKFGIQGTLSVDSMLLLPNIFAVEEKELDQTTKDLIFSNIKELIQDIVQQRSHEGRCLYDDIITRSATIKDALATIEQQSGLVIEVQKEKVKRALAELETDENKLAELQRNSAYVLLEKMDINEEIVRFKTHLDSLNNQLESCAHEKGKRLEFTLQELGREVNTMAAKCSDATIASCAIDIKVELEKIREQIQNCV